MRNFFLSATCILAMVLTGCINDNGEPDGANIQVGEKLPRFSVVMNDGGTVSNLSLDGKVSLIMLMTVTCPDCKAQLPIVESIYENYRNNDNVAILAISRQQGENIVGPYWRDNNLNLPYSAQNSRDVYSLFAQSGVPRIYISDRSGTVRKITTDSPIATYGELSGAINSLLE